MTPILLDTSCIVALLDRSERLHERCAGTVARIDGPLITCEAVIAESCYLLRNWPAAVRAVLENVERGSFAIPFQLSGRANRVARLMQKYSSVPMDLADACLVDLATEVGTGLILTLDSDFSIYRWGRNRPFKSLISTEPTG